MSLSKTSAWPLALTYVALVVYASLYPFSDWRSQGIAPWLFVVSAPPWYWSRFDIISNVLGYAPLGFLLCVAQMRSLGRGHGVAAALRAILFAALLSFMMETIQSYLPKRVPSGLDLLTNILGGCIGALVALRLERLGLLVQWSRFRASWFEPRAKLELVLLALWPCSLFFPVPVPFGLGQVMERLEALLATLLMDTPFLRWLPVRDVELQPLTAAAEVICIMLGLLLPCLLGYSVVRTLWRRAVLLALVLLMGVGVTAMSAALSAGPVHAWAWLDQYAQAGLGAGLVVAALLLPIPVDGCVVLLLAALVVHAGVVNQAAVSTYFAQTLQTWEQGRFIRFFGLAQWLGWLWPTATVLVMVRRLPLRRLRFGRT
ncbi:MAG: VanZ family protein [Hylemonella sp.]|nr:VanZ family protein [Hylemonella sp.]